MRSCTAIDDSDWECSGHQTAGNLCEITRQSSFIRIGQSCQSPKRLLVTPEETYLIPGPARVRETTGPSTGTGSLLELGLEKEEEVGYRKLGDTVSRSVTYRRLAPLTFVGLPLRQYVTEGLPGRKLRVGKLCWRSPVSTVRSLPGQRGRRANPRSVSAFGFVWFVCWSSPHRHHRCYYHHYK